MKNHYKTIWISDIHIGTRDCKALLLLDFLKSVSADKIYLVGDIIDGWALRRKWFWSKEHNLLLRRIIKMSKNTEIILIPGNHDDFMRLYCPIEFGGIKIKSRDVHETADGKKLLVVHGDMFDSFLTDNKILSLLGNLGYDLLLMANNFHHWLLKFFNKRYWSLSQYVRAKTKKVVNVVKNFENAAMNYAKKKGYDGIVCGHIHTASIRRDGEVLYVNDGDWVDSCTAACEDFEGNIEIVYWRK